MDRDKFKIPGTNITLGGILNSVLSSSLWENTLSPLLSVGTGLLLSQITHIADNLSKETVQNWVKRQYVDPPRSGRFYDENQVARILIFNALRKALELDDIKLLIQRVIDSSKGLFREKDLLALFHHAVIKTRDISSGDLEGYEKAVGAELAERLEAQGDSGETIKEVIYIMLTAYQSVLLKQQAQELIEKLKTAKQNQGPITGKGALV